MALITTRNERALQAARASVLIILVGLLVAALPGCQKRLDPEEYGQVVEGLPKVQGAEKARALPELQGDDQLPKGAEKFFK